MAVDLKAFDPAAYLDDAESLAAYLDDALGDGDPAEFLEALAVAARAKGMTEASKDGALPAAQRALGVEGRPEFATVQRILRSLDLDMHVSPRKASATKAA